MFNVNSHTLIHDKHCHFVLQHMIISMKKLTIHLEEVLLWKLVQFAGVGEGRQDTSEIDQGTDDLQKYVCFKEILINMFYFLKNK